MASRKLPAIQLAEPVDLSQFAQQLEVELNDIIVRINEDVLGSNLNAGENQIKNLQHPTEGHDAVNLDTLKKFLQNLRKEFISLNRPRRPGAIPGEFREFSAEHFQRHPEALCADADPYIRVSVKLPVQADKGVGLTDELVLKRNTDYIKLQSDWTTLTGTLTTGGTSMTVNDPTYIKSNTLYLIEEEYIRTRTVAGTNPILVDRAQEGSEDVGHANASVVKWAAILPKEGFSADENGILGATFEIKNSERVAQRVFEGWSVNADDIPGGTSTYTLTLSTGHAIADLAADPRFGEVILSWSELGGDTYRYQIYKAINGTATAGNAAQFYKEIPTDGTGVTFWSDPLPRPGDANPAMGTWLDTFHYAVHGINILCQGGTADTVGPLQGDASTTNPASDVSGISASESPACGADGVTMSEITASWSSQPSDVDKVRIYWLKDGDTNPSLVAAAEASPVKFTVPTIDPAEVQTVSLYFVSVSAEGVENGILSSPSTTVDVDGQTSAPNPPTGLACQIVEGGINLWWTPNNECDLYGYEIADTGDIQAANQSHITDAHVIGFVAATPESTVKPHFFFKETLYEGSSDGTSITMSEDVFKANQLLVNSVGRNVQFVGDYSGTLNPSVQVVSNTVNSITFAAASIPSGTVKFFLRGSGGEHNFKIRAVNNSNQKSEWRPEPPTHLECSPLAPDGTVDTGVPKLRTIAPNGSSFSQNGHLLQIIASAEGDVTTAANLNGAIDWTFVVKYEAANGVGGTNTSTVVHPTDPAKIATGVGSYKVLTDVINLSEFTGQRIVDITYTLRNWFGQANFTQLSDINGTAGDSSGPNRYIKPEAPKKAITAAISASSNFDLQKALVYEHDLTANLIVADPDNANVGDNFTVVLTQDATGGRTVTWHSNFKFPNDAWKNPDPRANKRTVYQFYVLDSSNFLLASPPVGGV